LDVFVPSFTSIGPFWNAHVYSILSVFCCSYVLSCNPHVFQKPNIPLLSAKYHCSVLGNVAGSTRAFVCSPFFTYPQTISPALFTCGQLTIKEPSDNVVGVVFVNSSFVLSFMSYTV
jgi:hypothetical protein